MCNFDNMEDVDAADLCRYGAVRSCARRMIMLPAALCAGGPAADSRRINEKYRFTVYAYRRK